ncbi:pentatricopeptide repeat-containing protein At3g49170, chloroplastic-like [Salvia splendens]|uniref:pentatricopeptide repeat-containing protein At3g49170, chloroplastic-like n=1 Tax=Salvia splendens TaxID=180675 RepID=UPI0011039D46|nr:pentatricopeptide repeat-containing protein At3g49170, chloroplastic-like [Salvia splendens]
MIRLSLPSTASPPLKPNHHHHSRRQTSTTPKPPDIITFESLKSRIIRHADAGRLHEAISTLDLMSGSNLSPDLTTYSVLLKSCIRTRSFDLGRALHSKLENSGIQLDHIVLNSLISLYSKCGDWKKAEEIFASMGGGARDLVSWSAMISGYAHSGLNSEAIALFFEMVEFGERPNQFCFSAAIRACSNREYAGIGLVIFGFVVKSGYFESDVCVGCALVDLFGKGFGDLESAKKVFDEMPERNSVSWTLMITRFMQMGDSVDAIELFSDMLIEGYVPDRFTFSSVLSACSEVGSLDIGRQLHSWVVKTGLTSDVCVGCSLVDMYAKSTVNGSMDESRKVFDRMAEHNVMSWTAIITGYVQKGGCDVEAIELYSRMITKGRVRPNHFTFASLLKVCGNLFNPRLGEQIHGQAIKSSLAEVNCVGNSLISMYAKMDMMEDARKAFEFLFEKNLVSFNALVDGYSRNLGSGEAFGLFNQIGNASVGADAFTFASLLSGAASIGAVGKGEQLHARLLKAGFASNLSVCNALISMYTRCGDIEAGFQAFEEMGVRNVISWTSIITGFAKHGLARRALDLFEEMLDFGVKPNEVTFVAVLSACSHAGLVNEGRRHFDSMSKEHGIRPRMEHYACMVDVLGRSGFLNEAMEFIESMPFPPDALVWRTLLGACSVHGDAALGKRAADMIIEQDPSDPAAHVLLSNLYASAGQWEDVAKIRKGMKERNVVKEAGCSWIETANTVHKFYVGDTKHPEAREIYEELERLVVEIKGMGYVPDTRYVMHEVEEGEKERYLFQHSEKIALAYGLISTGKAKPIRIFKNLRVCGDCHAAMKYASMATGREIVVRDSNRFHHIKGGRCSCNDYW